MGKISQDKLLVFARELLDEGERGKIVLRARITFFFSLSLFPLY
jgi:hypothetical protein